MLFCLSFCYVACCLSMRLGIGVCVLLFCILRAFTYNSGHSFFLLSVLPAQAMNGSGSRRQPPRQLCYHYGLHIHGYQFLQFVCLGAKSKAIHVSDDDAATVVVAVVGIVFALGLMRRLCCDLDSRSKYRCRFCP